MNTELFILITVCSKIHNNKLLDILKVENIKDNLNIYSGIYTLNSILAIISTSNFYKQKLIPPLIFKNRVLAYYKIL